MSRSLSRWMLVLISTLCAAQDVPSVVFHGNCATQLPRFQQWFKSTKLPYGQPYSISSERKERIIGNYAKLTIGMTLEEVERLLGDPDFSNPLPPPRLTNLAEPIGIRCADQVAYIFAKSTENMTDLGDEALYLVFSRNGALYWGAPQNMPTLKQLGSPTLASDPSFAKKNIESAGISVIAGDGVVTGDRYTNSFFKLTINTSDATLQLNPQVNTSGDRGRLLQALSKTANREETYTFAVLADCLSHYPQLDSLSQYVQAVRHNLEKERLSTVREEFPISIGGKPFVGAILEVRESSERKHYRGLYSTFLNGYILSLDLEAASETKLNDLVSAVKFTN